MAVKTITIDLDAYEALRRRKRRGQSFSDVIKEHFTGPSTARALKRALGDLRFGETTLDAVDRIVEARAHDLSRTPRL